MNKVKDIILSWGKSLSPSNEDKVLAEQRLTICNDCPLKQLTFNIEVCGECGCPLNKKVYSANGCPLGKW